MGAAQSGSMSQGAADRSSNGASASGEDDPCVPLKDDRFCWTIDPITGLTYQALPDTNYIGMGNKEAMESKALAMAFTGNLWGPHQSEDYFARPDRHDFIFANAYGFYRSRPQDVIFYNTKVPFTAASYMKSGANLQTNDHLKINFAGNFNRQLGIGTSLDYTYARGEFTSSAAKPIKWTSYAYYHGERYKASLTANIGKYANQENGGVLDRNYVLYPDSYDDNFTRPRTMPTRLVNTWNDTRHRQFHFTHSYDLGFWKEVTDPADSTVTEHFTSVASIFHTVDFESYHHNFRMDKNAEGNDEKFFKHRFIDKSMTHDSTSYRDFSTFAGIRLNEGFNRYSQFGLAAMVGYERQHYILLQDTLQLGFIDRNHVSDNVWVGGQLSRHLSSAFTIDATLKTCIAGDKRLDIDAHGSIRTVIPFGKADSLRGHPDSLIVKASARMNNSRTSWLMEHYFSNHFRWNQRLKREQSMRIEGEIEYPRSGTRIKGGVENINNFHYFSASDSLPLEYDKQLTVLGFEARQTLHAGNVLYWENAVLVQTTFDAKALSLPTLSIESDLNIRFRIARTLHTQLGVVGYYHTKYYAPNYQPATQQFEAQDEIKCGGFPVLNGYANFNLKRIKFFVMMYNMLNGALTNNTFIIPDYPVIPRRFEWGVTLDLQN